MNLMALEWILPWFVGTLDIEDIVCFYFTCYQPINVNVGYTQVRRVYWQRKPLAKMELFVKSFLGRYLLDIFNEDNT